MPFTKTTIRALAASVVIVAAGGTVAGAAVFHLPILGFGRADVASANVTSAIPPTSTTVAKKVRPRVVVKTRVVDDIVHRPAPVSAYRAPAPVAPAPTIAASAASAASAAPAAPPTTAYAPARPATTVATTAAPWSEYEHESDDSGEHDPSGHGESSTAASPEDQ